MYAALIINMFKPHNQVDRSLGYGHTKTNKDLYKSQLFLNG